MVIFGKKAGNMEYLEKVGLHKKQFVTVINFVKRHGGLCSFRRSMTMVRRLSGARDRNVGIVGEKANSGIDRWLLLCYSCRVNWL